LEYARTGAQTRMEQLRAELAALETAFGAGKGRGRRGNAAAASTGAAAPKKRKMSAAGRARIVAAAKARWAKWRKEKGK
jgi:hypothetical protein